MPDGTRRYHRGDVLARIERLREEHGLSRRDLASLVGVNQDAFYKKLQGKNPFLVEELGKLAEALGAPTGWPFIDEEDGDLLDAVKRVITSKREGSR